MNYDVALEFRRKKNLKYSQFRMKVLNDIYLAMDAQVKSIEFWCRKVTHKTHDDDDAQLESNKTNKNTKFYVFFFRLQIR